jgi:hypothetical protein
MAAQAALCFVTNIKHQGCGAGLAPKRTPVAEAVEVEVVSRVGVNPLFPDRIRNQAVHELDRLPLRFGS